MMRGIWKVLNKEKGRRKLCKFIIIISKLKEVIEKSLEIFLNHTIFTVVMRNEEQSQVVCKGELLYKLETKILCTGCSCKECNIFIVV